jgi:hypothetical protein
VTPYTAYLILEDETQRNVPMAQRSLQSFDGDGGARREAEQAWSNFKKESSGGGAVASARYGMAFKSANAAAPAAVNGAIEARRSLGLSDLASSVAEPSSADRSKDRLVQYAQQTQFVAGKSFFQNEKQWIDSAVQKQSNAKRVRIQFGSADYFDLVARTPEALPWLALGQNVQFVLNNMIYDIYE